MTDINNFQRIGSPSNAHVGRDFEKVAVAYFETQGVRLQRDVPLEIGHRTRKGRRFDLVSLEDKVVVECKSHAWTSSGNSPSAKLTVWNEAMYLFTLLPDEFRKVLFVGKDLRKDVALADHYVKNYGYLIPHSVEILEFCESTATVRHVLERAKP